MNTRHNKLMNLKEDEDDDEIFGNIHRQKDSDEEYNIKEEDDLYSNVDDDEEEEEDASYMISNVIKKDIKKTTNKKKTPKKTKANKETKKKILRKSFKNSLGRQKVNKHNNIDNKENVNNNIKEIPKNKNKDNKKSKSVKKARNDDISKNTTEKQVIDIQLDKSYFYQNLTPTQWNEISNYISSSLYNKDLKEEDIEYFFSQYPNLYKGENNIKKLRQILDDSSKKSGFLNFYSRNFEFESYKKLNEFILNNYYIVKPSIFEVHFFPNPSEEIHLINLISKTKNSLDIAMFTINNVRIAEVIKNIYYKGIKLRILTDGECIKMPSSNIYSLAAIGISVKTDDSVRYHMHHKFCVIDNSVVATGSFNWTDQAVKHNQENLLFLENKSLAKQYSNEFQKLWDDFEIVITKEKALMKIREDEEKKRAAESRKQKEKEKKLIEKENKKKEIEFTENKSYNKTFSKKKRNRNENKENKNNNCDNDDYDNYDESNRNQFNNNNNVNKGSNCFIF